MEEGEGTKRCGSEEREGCGEKGDSGMGGDSSHSLRLVVKFYQNKEETKTCVIT